VSRRCHRGQSEDALAVEMRIEGGEILDCPCNLADQVENSPFSLPGITEQARQEPSLGGKFGRNAWLASRASTKARRSAGRFGKASTKGSRANGPLPVGFARRACQNATPLAIGARSFATGAVTQLDGKC